MARFESLPNEIIIQCFEYFNAIDLLLSFYQLNERLNQLVRTIKRLFVDFRDANISKFNVFCEKLSSNCDLKDQIYSLELSNRSKCEIYLFLSRFSLDEFTNLQSLTLIEAQQHDKPYLQTNHLTISCLFSLNLLDYEKENRENSSSYSYSTSTLHILMKDNNNFDISLIQKLTITTCANGNLNTILRDATNLKYLEIHVFTRCSYSYDPKYDIEYQHTHLVQLKIKDFRPSLDTLEVILIYIPKLQNLLICQFDYYKTVSANRWEQIINDLLPNLKIFQFTFNYQRTLQIDHIYKEFQSDFWIREHQWYTECFLYKSYIVIYTTPYLLEKYTLLPITDRHSSQTNRFDEVKYLEITTIRLDNNRFPRVESISFDEQSIQSIELIVNDLSSVINMNLLKSLIFPLNYRCRKENSSILLNILKQAPHVSTLSMNSEQLSTLLTDDNDLCEHLHRMIKKLDLGMSLFYFPKNFYEINLFWQVFSNIEQLICAVNSLESIGFLFKYLFKLLRFEMSAGRRLSNLNASITQQANEVGLKIFTNYFIHSYITECIIWIIRDTN